MSQAEVSQPILLVTKSQELLAGARKLVDAMQGVSCLCRNTGDTCIAVEGNRPLEMKDIKLGKVFRAFNDYNPDNLCLGCRACWHQIVAADCLHKLQSLATKEEGKTRKEICLPQR